MNHKLLNRIICALTTMGITVTSSGYSTVNALTVDSQTDINGLAAENTVTESYTDTSDLTDTQLNSLNMLNYLTVLTQEVNDSKGSNVYQESVYSSLINNTYPNAVDTTTQSKLTNLLDTIEDYRMLDVKREHLEYIYEQNRAQAIKKAIPNPIGILSTVSSKDIMGAIISVIYLAVDSVSNYQSAVYSADMQYLQDGWELDEKEAEILHASRKEMFSYMLTITRNTGIPGDYTLNETAVENFVKWKQETNLTRKTEWFKSNESTYAHYGPYWLEMAKCYYDAEDYQGCLDAIGEYNNISSRIFRKDYDYADALPMAVLSAKETMNDEYYVDFAESCCDTIMNNCSSDDWVVEYFVAQTYLDLAKVSGDSKFLEKAYKIAFDNVNVLVDDQKAENQEYLELTNYKNQKAESGASKQQKADIKNYNKMMKEKQKTSLPPVNQAFYVNCELLFALADELEVSDSEKQKISNILRDTEDEAVFLTDYLDSTFRYDDHDYTLSSEVTYESGEIQVPVSLLSDSATVTVTVSSGGKDTEISDLAIKKVNRQKSTDISKFVAVYTSDESRRFGYSDGDEITVKVQPTQYSSDEPLEFRFRCHVSVNFLKIKSYSFEQIS